MFLEGIAIFSLQAKEKLETFLNSLIRVTNSQIALLLFLLNERYKNSTGTTRRLVLVDLGVL
jgi:hypothetical protein